MGEAGAIHELPLRVKEFLRRVNFFSGLEIQEISRAVKNHSRKEVIGTPLEEIAKDCDILDCYYLGLPPKKEAHIKRFAALERKRHDLLERV
jgi:uncharacterized protein